MKHNKNRMGVGIALGAAIGTTFGIFSDHPAQVLAISIALGAILGVVLTRLTSLHDSAESGQHLHH